MMHPTAVMVLHSMSMIAAGSQVRLFSGGRGCRSLLWSPCRRRIPKLHQPSKSQVNFLYSGKINFPVLVLSNPSSRREVPTGEGDAHLGHQGLTLTDAWVNRATSQPYPLTFLHPFVFSLHITGFRNLRLNASATISSKDR